MRISIQTDHPWYDPARVRGPFFRHIISGRSCWILRCTSTARVAIRISRFMPLSILYWRRYILFASRFLHRSRTFPFSLPALRPVLFTTSRPRRFPCLSIRTLSLVVIVDTTSSLCYQRHIGIARRIRSRKLSFVGRVVHNPVIQRR